jgi:hypothetical protein
VLKSRSKLVYSLDHRLTSIAFHLMHLFIASHILCREKLEGEGLYGSKGLVRHSRTKSMLLINVIWQPYPKTHWPITLCKPAKWPIAQKNYPQLIHMTLQESIYTYTLKKFTLTLILFLCIIFYFFTFTQGQCKYFSNTFTWPFVNVLQCVKVYIIYPKWICFLTNSY